MQTRGVAFWLTALAAVAFFSVGCRSLASSSSGVVPGEDNVLAPAVDPNAAVSDGDGAEASTLTMTVRPHESNSLMAVVDVLLESAASVTIDFSAEETMPRSVTSSSAETAHSFTVVGLRSETDYRFNATSSDGATSLSPAVFRTGGLPVGLPAIEIVHRLETDGPGEDGSAGITFFGRARTPGEADGEGPAAIGIDAAGHVVWYLEAESDLSRDPVIRSDGTGAVLMFFADEMQRLDLDGTVVERFDLSTVSSWHHDAVLLPDGGLLALGRETREQDGQLLQGDLIVELNSDGGVVSEWSTFDHLDTTRFPGELAKSEVRSGSGALDWTHSNSVYLDVESDEVLLSSRSQSWIVSINRASGEIAWIAGDASGGSGDFGAPFLELLDGSWPSAQHAATRLTDRGLLVYDNRNETGGAADQSRVVIYDIDEEMGTAAQRFEYILPKFTRSLGDVDELANGNLLATAGGPGSSPTAHLVEIDRNGSLIWEATVEQSIYRAERVPWADVDGRAVEGEPLENKSTDEPASENEGSAAPPSDAEGVVDLTNAILTSSAVSCASHVGTYRSAVQDVQSGQAFEGALTIDAGGGSCTIRSNQIPNHDMGIDANFANEVGEVEGLFEITSSPSVNGESTALDFAVNAVLLNGVVWEAYAAACFGEGPDRLGRERIGCGPRQLENPWRYNIGSPLNSFQLDAFSAHAQASGLYHYHSTPEALYEIDCSGVAASPVIGFARDGFPIHGPCFEDTSGVIRAATSSYRLRTGDRQDVEGFTTPSIVGAVVSATHDGQFNGDHVHESGHGDLDECNGMTVGGAYGYYVTAGYPYVIACYRGTPSAVFGPE